MLKVLFAGTPDVAVPSLKLLAQDTEHFEVVAVLTRPDANRTRSQTGGESSQAGRARTRSAGHRIRSERGNVRVRACGHRRTGRRCGGVRQDPETGRARRAADGLVQPATSPCCPNGVAPLRCNVPSGRGRR